MLIAPADAQLPYAPISVIDVSMRHSHRRTVVDGDTSQLVVPAKAPSFARRLVGSSHDAFVATRVALLGPISKRFRA